MKSKKPEIYSFDPNASYWRTHYGKWVLFDLAGPEIRGWGNTLADAMEGLKFGKTKKQAFYQACFFGYNGFIPVTLFYKNKSITISAIPDSGAHRSMFGSEIAEYLGINLKK